MGHDHGCGIAAECLANHFPWMHLCPIDRSLKQLYVFDQAMARIEEGRPKTSRSSPASLSTKNLPDSAGFKNDA